MKVKKIPRYLALLLLTSGASLILGFLSFGGMFALWPILPLAFAAFVLSVAYEGEIYLQNIKGALNKLFKYNHLQRQLSNEYLLNNFPDTTPLLDNFLDATDEKCPLFFKKYKAERELFKSLEKLSNKSQDKAIRARKKQVEKNLRKMEKWFDLQLFTDQQIEASELTPDEKELRAWLVKHPPKWPQFFTDYERQLNILHQFGHAPLKEKNRADKKQEEKTLRDKEKWFALQLFSDKGPLTPYEKELRKWLALPTNKQNEQQALFLMRSKIFKAAKAFSTLAGVFMSLGTTYLLVEAFSIIPLFAALPFSTWPLLILPMAAIAGTAYGLLTYNSVTDMITNNTLRKWYDKIRNDLSDGQLTPRKVFITTTAVVLVLLAVTLTICTAGTWWTVAKETRPLFAWMGRMPTFIMGVINPIITGLSALVFNIQNTSESLEMIDNETRKKNRISSIFQSIRKGFHTLQDHENWLQIINPFRLFLAVTITPLRILLFLGHLVSIAATADRMPGIKQIFSIIIGIICEGFEDAHYFIPHDHGHKQEESTEDKHYFLDHHHGHKHEHKNHQGHAHECAHDHSSMSKKELLKERLSAGHGHNHNVDLPTFFLKLMFYPIYFMAACWDYKASQRNSGSRKPLENFTHAWEKQLGIPKEMEVKLPTDSQRPSAAWKITHAIYRIRRYKEKCLDGVFIGSDIAQQKSNALSALQEKLRNIDPLQEPNVNIINTITKELDATKQDPVYSQHRFFNNGQTHTRTFLDTELRERVSLCACAG